jgi:RHH-type transcriptional regulator, proline utilization regulon repressor / proline dehydrogenase / delta 1-pyrroline-5-carboxylate dehydrogenase
LSYYSQIFFQRRYIIGLPLKQDVPMSTAIMTSSPLANFAPVIRTQTKLRQAITKAYRTPEPEIVKALLPMAEIEANNREAIAKTAIGLVETLRKKGQRGGVEGLVKEYSLSTREGIALMCLAEALLRIPDSQTRDALIRDKISHGDWQSHLGDGRTLFVNAATWGLMVTGKLTASYAETGLASALTRLIARAGEPIIRHGVDMAMELMGEQFVTGETIAEALDRAKKREAAGFSYSYDMLGEAATTAADAARYFADYERAIHAIGKASAGRGIYSGPGISIKLSALHPRYSRAQSERVMNELLPRLLRELALIAKSYTIGLNIDAEESDRLEISLDLIESLALDPALADWNGLGCVIQAYGKRCSPLIDWLADLAKRGSRRIMVRLVKGAYWDSEIKRAQVDGQVDFPVFTRKVHTDISYIACAKKLLAHRDILFPQFATHNAQTVATIFHLAGPQFKLGDYEFQCLHGMGEPLYEEVVGPDKLNRPCRIYAPVGNHETLLAYLVRRLLENGANSSFVHRIWDTQISVHELAQDPAVEAQKIQPLGSPHTIVALPKDILGKRRNSAGLDLSNEKTLAELNLHLQASAKKSWQAAPVISGLSTQAQKQKIVNPSDHHDVVGSATFASERDAQFAAKYAARSGGAWSLTSVTQRAAILDLAADIMEGEMPQLLGLIMREAGKSLPNAIAEVREAVDFLRYYAAEARRTLSDRSEALGAVVCISPWNFPLAIFIGQIAAALVAGNAVLAKPAEETPLIAAEGVRLLYEAGIPGDALYFVPGDGKIGAALVGAPDIAAVMFTGSTEVAKLIQAEIAGHISPHGAPIPLIAETGGQNAMIVDSSALAEQVVADVITSAFDSAGQRCSALRILCLQEDIAERQLAMLKGALVELNVGNTDRLETDIGPVITTDAKATIEAHIARMRALGCAIHQVTIPAETTSGTFVAPTIIEVDSLEQIGREVFGPVLHVLRWKRDQLDSVIDAINGTGYGLTFGLHTRLDDTIEHVISKVRAGNIYVNRNVIGAVVGVQPFGGRGLSGTGPKAGGPLYLGRLVQSAPDVQILGDGGIDPAVEALAGWLEKNNQKERAVKARRLGQARLNGHTSELPGPVGERNLYALHPRGKVLLLPATPEGLLDQLMATLAEGNSASIVSQGSDVQVLAGLPESVKQRIEWLHDMPTNSSFGAVLIEWRGGDQKDRLRNILKSIAQMSGAIPLVQIGDSEGRYRADWLVEEISISTNTTAAGGNAKLMAMV